MSASRFRGWHDIAYVPQRLLAAGAVPVSVYETVSASAISPRTRFAWFSRSRATAVRSALERVDLWARRHDRIDTLSGGQQRRVLIAAALAKGATTFVLDEPTAGVDADNQRAIATVFEGIRDAGGTVVLVTHELGAFTDLATRVVVLDHGEVAYDGPPPVPDALDASRHDHHHEEDLAPQSPPPSAAPNPRLGGDV